jgi:ribosomal protein S12 methylthiotransferase
MKAQHAIATELNARLMGATIPVLIEEYDSERDLYKGRSAWDAPQIDNQVYVTDKDGSINIGEIVEVKIYKVDTYDLFAKPVDLIETPAQEAVLSATK